MSKTEFRGYRPGELIRNGEQRYRVEQQISRGKFGHAFACRDHWERPRIIQVLWPLNRSYRAVREDWLERVEELLIRRHDTMVCAECCFEHEELFHLVLDRCANRLDRYLVQPAWDGDRWLRPVAYAVLRALDHLHGAGYVHRNLHPHNVFCTMPLERLHPDSAFGGALRLGDFEVNTLLGKVDVLNTKIPRWLVPPEYLNPSELGELDYRMDIYQAGLLLLCVLTGKLPRFTYEEISAGLPAENAAKLPSGYGMVIARALQPQVEERFGSALAFWQALCGE